MTRHEHRPEPAPRRSWELFSSLKKYFIFEERQQKHLLMFLLAFVVTVIIVPKGGFVPDYYAPGDIASRDIKSPKDLLIPDLPLTEQKRMEAEGAVPPLYDFDPRAGRDIAERLVQTLQFLNAEARKGVPPENLHKEAESRLGVSLTDQELKSLSEVPAVAEDLEHLMDLISRTLAGKVVGNLQLFQADREKGVVIRNLVTQSEAVGLGQESVSGLNDVESTLNAQLKATKSLTGRHRQTLFGVTQKLLRPNLTFNKNETEARKRAAGEAVKPVLFQVKKGEMIVREGERISEEQIKKLRALRDIGNDYSTLRTAFGLFITISLLLFSCHRFARRNIRKYRPQSRDLIFLVSIFIGLFVLIKVSIFIANALESAFPYIDSPTYYYLFPFAAGAMLVRIVLNSEVALIFAILSSLLLGVLFGNSLFISLYALAGSLTAAHWVRHCKERSTLFRAGFRLSLVNALMVFGFLLVAGRPLDVQFLFKLAFALAGGLVCAVIVNGTIPLVESLFKYTTDIKLLELANMNTPVLRELMIQAPGTYHHSVIVGNLVEAAAEAISANPLLARVAAYYHDIGKIRKPLYFVENLGNQENRHDKLAPSMSALILMSHVKDGVEVARDNRLGAALVEIIRQHHGTALIKFFYDRAKSKEDPGVQQVDERDYRYPGPKPQTREAALIMLADAVEAASRTLTEPTPARIQGMVQKIINNIFIDGQLDECELTLKDLHNIAKSFNRILAGIFHHRIDYPEPAYKERDKESSKRKNGEDTHREPAKAAKDKEVEPAKGSSEDLKRLGMS
jgi:putative nucleotidyltransferase with HDIG domain